MSARQEGEPCRVVKVWSPAQDPFPELPIRGVTCRVERMIARNQNEEDHSDGPHVRLQADGAAGGEGFGRPVCAHGEA